MAIMRDKMSRKLQIHRINGILVTAKLGSGRITIVLVAFAIHTINGKQYDGFCFLF
jgi:hypothetical protein